MPTTSKRDNQSSSKDKKILTINNSSKKISLVTNSSLLNTKANNKLLNYNNSSANYSTHNLYTKTEKCNFII